MEQPDIKTKLQRIENIESPVIRLTEGRDEMEEIAPFDHIGQQQQQQKACCDPVFCQAVFDTGCDECRQFQDEVKVSKGQIESIYGVSGLFVQPVSGGHMVPLS